MSVNAALFQSARFPATLCVDRRSDRLKMRRIATLAVPAQMVKEFAGGDGTDQELEDDFMSERATATIEQLAVPIWAKITLTVPTRRTENRMSLFSDFDFSFETLGELLKH